MRAVPSGPMKRVTSLYSPRMWKVMTPMIGAAANSTTMPNVSGT